MTRSADRARRFVLPGAVAVAVLALDQYSKGRVTDWLGPTSANARRDLVGRWFAFEYVENTGAAFGAFTGRSNWLIVVVLAVIAGLMVYYLRAPGPAPTLVFSLGLLVGGAFGNLIDRFRHGHVVDFIAVGDWPRFNMADTAVTFGVVLLARHVIVGERSKLSESERGAAT